MASSFGSSFLSSLGSSLPGAIGGIGSFLGNQISSAINSKRAWKYAKKAMYLQDKYNRNMIKDYYSLNRESLENADYNPLLAVPGSTANGASYSPTMFNSDSDNGSQAISSAMQAMSLKNETKQANASSALANEQAETEKAKRVQMEFQNAKTDIETQLQRKDLSWYERRATMELYDMYQRAENYKASSAIGMMNAETQRQNMLNSYELGKYHNETERGNKSVHIGPVSVSGYADIGPNFGTGNTFRERNQVSHKTVAGYNTYSYKNYR